MLSIIIYRQIMRYISKHTLTLLVLSFFTFSLNAQIVRMETVLGNIDIELHPDAAPVTVANFLNYVNDGDYDNSYIHRSVTNFVIQGGGFTNINGLSGAVSTDSPIINESSLSNSNVRGTISMARTNDLNSATSQWFFNTVDNTNLDGNGTGYAVFGSVINGMNVVDAIAALQIWNGGGAISNIPLINYSGSGSINNHLVLISKVELLNQTLNINPGLNGAWFNTDTPGQGIMIEILPTLDSVFMAWFTFDSQDPSNVGEATVGSVDQRWLTGFGVIDHNTNSITLDLTNTSGGKFDNNATVSNSAVSSYGSLTLHFNDCENATVNYDLINQNLTGSYSMKRISTDNVALCESLSQAASK